VSPFCKGSIQAGHAVLQMSTFIQTRCRLLLEKTQENAGETHFLQVGVLVNNAGMTNPAWDQDCWDEIMTVNYTGAISLAEQILPVLADGAPARICQMTSIAVPLCVHDVSFGLVAPICLGVLCNGRSTEAQQQGPCMQAAASSMSPASWERCRASPAMHTATKSRTPSR
jgi:NAD(P)-dependent dehydrogenase (short-subunit alcohol dehydrogenase family)